MDDLCTCPVCYNTYDVNSHIPRLLPCSHTLCHTCIQRLAQRIFSGTFYLSEPQTWRVKCPQCLEQHQFESHRQFLQNRYIVTYQAAQRLVRKPVLKDETCQVEPEGRKFENCSKHSRWLSLFCKDGTCSKAICQICLLHDHRTHNVVDIIDQENRSRAKFQDTCDLILANIKEKREDLEELKVKLEKEFKAIKKNMEKEKTDVIAQISRHFESNFNKVSYSFWKEPGLLSKTEAAIFALSETTRKISDMQRDAGHLKGNDVIDKNKEKIDMLNDLIRRTNENVAAIVSHKNA